jgi:hypothetical protein
MHCEQNLSNNMLKTITGHKNIMKVRRDLQCRGIKKHLWLTSNVNKKSGVPFHYDTIFISQGVHCTKLVRIHVNAQEGY